MAKARKAEPAVDVDTLIEAARERLEADGFVKLASLGPKAARSRVAEELRAAGFELTKSAVRRPLRDQLLASVEHGAFVPVKSITSFVRGGTAAEAAKVAAELVEEGRVVRVVRGTAEVLVPAAASVYSRDELTVRRRALEGLVQLLARASKRKDLTILQADLVESLTEAFPELSRAARSSAPPSARRDTPAADAFSRLFAALDATRDDALGLSFIPRVMDRLVPEIGKEAARTSLQQAADRGLVELRPEGGIHRLTADELELCLPGPQGTRLSWARRVEGTMR